ncbi:hypothetical protein GUJ93_ZPchr0004g38236 [Zizania palustris]|uniref:Uncharacterized protein n=1 Tax=Zizania palustris TaxID=103762 RepID=A0A8J5VZN7_ZIZPA|nr:hypothetical protein GUJ93_ZPchr0004g38236 [Zizania palustris]
MAAALHMMAATAPSEDGCGSALKWWLRRRPRTAAAPLDGGAWLLPVSNPTHGSSFEMDVLVVVGATCRHCFRMRPASFPFLVSG